MIPVHKNIKDLVTKKKFESGNFGLWFYKFIELEDNNLKIKNKDLSEYEDLCKNNKFLKTLIEKKHKDQSKFCKSKEKTHKTLIYRATLSSPLVTGIGNTHPSEVGMTIDHNLGIPYIPASSLKGIVRFVHTISLADEAFKMNKVDVRGYFDDEADWTKISTMFGKGGDDGNRGKVIFLDAYPENPPQLHVDIMNPHYLPYYSERKPPADDHKLIPIKFLTVAKGTTFEFRVLIDKRASDIEQAVSTAIKNALEIEGIGAKTAVGYGRFVIESQEELKNKIDDSEKECLTEEEKINIEIKNLINEIQATNNNDRNRIDYLFQQWQKNDKISNNKEIAEAFKLKVNEKKKNGEYTSHYKKIAEILDINLKES